MKEAYKELKKAESVSFERQKEFIGAYIARCEKDRNVSPEIMKKSLQREGKQKELG